MTMISQTKDNAAAVALLREFNQRTIAYQPIYRKITGSTTSAILLSQLMFWWAKVKQREFYKTDLELMEETALTLDEYKYAKARLKKMPFMQIERKGVPARTFYVINENALIAEIAKLSLCNSHCTDSGNPTNCNVDIPPTITIEDTKEDTREKEDVVLANDAPSKKAVRKKTAVRQDVQEMTDAVINYLNKVTGREFESTTIDSINAIKYWMDQGITFDEFKKVIDFQTSEWLNDEKMKKYLHPDTLFSRKKFKNKYLADANFCKAKNSLPDPSAPHYQLAMHIQNTYPNLWSSNVRIFNAAEYADYQNNVTMKGMALQAADNKRKALAAIMAKLNEDYGMRQKYNSLFDAYIALAKTYLP